MDHKGVTILVPVLDRVQNWEPLIQSINANTEDPWIIFIQSPNREVKDKLTELFIKYDNVEYFTMQNATTKGDYARKINKASNMVFSEWFFTGADDLRFYPNWFENAMNLANDNVHVIGTNDMGSRRVMKGLHSTHTLVRTEYAREHGLTVEQKPGLVLCETYWHEFVDDELVGMAKKLGVWAFAYDSFVEHMHPCWGKGVDDASYQQQGERMAYSRATFENRQKLWT